jgi:hypothetical protein
VRAVCCNSVHFILRRFIPVLLIGQIYMCIHYMLRVTVYLSSVLLEVFGLNQR